MLSLSTSQVKAKTLFKEWLDNPSMKYFHLVGAAGRGKTWVYVNALHNLINDKKYILNLTSSTNQGVTSFNHVVAEAIKVTSNNIDDAIKNGTAVNIVAIPTITTLHSFLGLVPSSKPCSIKSVTDKIGNDFYYTVNLYSPIRTEGILVVDEAYRIDKQIMLFINEYFPNYRIVFIYDPYQTRPISNNAWTLEDCLQETINNSCKVELIEPRRSKPNTAITSLVDLLYLAVKFKEKSYLDLIPNCTDGNIKVSTTKLDIKPVLDEYVINFYGTTWKKKLVVTGTREAARQFNNYILAERHKAKLPLLINHDELSIEYMFSFDNSNLPRDVRNIRQNPEVGNQLTNFIFHESINLKVHEPYKLIQRIFDSSKVYKINNYDYFVLYTGTGLTTEELKQFWSYLRQYGIRFFFIRLNNVKTIHSAQGITTEHLILHKPSIEKWASIDDKLRLYYTGASRASNLLTIVE